MQTKKDEVKNSLLNAACREFLDMGFEKASIRRIVTSANTTIGNFYNYFESKEKIFSELVDEVYQGFIHMVTTHNDEGEIPFDELGMDSHMLRAAMHPLLESLMPNINDRFLLLVARSEGTKYQGVRAELTAVLAGHFYDHIKEHKSSYQYRAMGDILATQLLSAICHILTTIEDIDQQKELIIEQMVFTIFGMIALIK